MIVYNNNCLKSGYPTKFAKQFKLYFRLELPIQAGLPSTS